MGIWNELDDIAAAIKHHGEVDLERVRVACRRAQEVVAVVDQLRAGTITVWPADDDGMRRVDVSFELDDPAVLFDN